MPNAGNVNGDSRAAVNSYATTTSVPRMLLSSLLSGYEWQAAGKQAIGREEGAMVDSSELRHQIRKAAGAKADQAKGQGARWPRTVIHSRASKLLAQVRKADQEPVDLALVHLGQHERVLGHARRRRQRL